MKIAVFLPNWLGDVAMATPTLRAMRRHFGPQTRIVGIMRPYLADVLAGTDWLDEQWHYHPRGKDRSQRAWAIARRMRAERFDMAVLLTNSLRTAVVAWLGRAKQRIGYVRYGRGPLLTSKLYPRRIGRKFVPEPMVETYLEVARVLGCGEESPRLELTTIEADERSADGVFERLGLRACLHNSPLSLWERDRVRAEKDGLLENPSKTLTPPSPPAPLPKGEGSNSISFALPKGEGSNFPSGERGVIALNSSGAYGGSKLWPVEYFGELAQRIVAELDCDVLVMCGPKERDIAREVVRLSGGDRVFSMADQPMDLGTAKACIRRCRLMVSTDSGPRHVAAALGLPVVTMFGPMLPVWSENPTQRAINLVLDLDCIGCHKRVCPLGHHRCMRDLTVDRVFAAVKELL